MDDPQVDCATFSDVWTPAVAFLDDARSALCQLRHRRGLHQAGAKRPEANGISGCRFYEESASRERDRQSPLTYIGRVEWLRAPWRLIGTWRFREV